MADEFPCPNCGGRRPWQWWGSRDGRGCRHPQQPSEGGQRSSEWVSVENEPSVPAPPSVEQEAKEQK